MSLIPHLAFRNAEYVVNIRRNLDIIDKHPDPSEE